MGGQAASSAKKPDLIFLDGRTLAEQIREELRLEIIDFEEELGRPPGLAMIVVGDDRRALEYALHAVHEAQAIGMAHKSCLLPVKTTDQELQALISELNSNPSIDGISIQAPLPYHINFEEAIASIDPVKDAEGYHPLHVGRLFSGLDTMVPPPAAGGMELLLRYNIHPAGMHAVVVGRSRLIGKPLSALLAMADATVSLCHSETRDLAYFTRQADLLITCAGVRHLITGDMLKPGTVILNYGYSWDEDDNLVGDVEWDSAVKVASAISPTPGGTSPMTTVALLANTIKAAQRLISN